MKTKHNFHIKMWKKVKKSSFRHEKTRSAMILTQPEVEKGGAEHVETEKAHGSSLGREGEPMWII